MSQNQTHNDEKAERGPFTQRNCKKKLAARLATAARCRFSGPRPNWPRSARNTKDNAMPTDDDAPRRAARAKPATAGEYDVIPAAGPRRPPSWLLIVIGVLAGAVISTPITYFAAKRPAAGNLLVNAQHYQPIDYSGFSKIEVEEPFVIFDEFKTQPLKAYEKYNNKIVVIKKFSMENDISNGSARFKYYPFVKGDGPRQVNDGWYRDESVYLMVIFNDSKTASGYDPRKPCTAQAVLKSVDGLKIVFEGIGVTVSPEPAKQPAPAKK